VVGEGWKGGWREDPKLQERQTNQYNVQNDKERRNGGKKGPPNYNNDSNMIRTYTITCEGTWGHHQKKRKRRE